MCYNILSCSKEIINEDEDEDDDEQEERMEDTVCSASQCIRPMSSANNNSLASRNA